MSEHILKRHNKTLLLYHLVFPLKYLKSVITNEIGEGLKNICLEISERYEVHFIEIGYESNHVHFIGESCTSGAYGEAEAIGADTCIVYCDGLADTTAAHELYHAMGLYHSFSNSGAFTFDYRKTDCIMDYSDISPATMQVIQFYKWQWEILRTNAKVKNE